MSHCETLDPNSFQQHVNHRFVSVANLVDQAKHTCSLGLSPDQLLLGSPPPPKKNLPGFLLVCVWLDLRTVEFQFGCHVTTTCSLLYPTSRASQQPSKKIFILKETRPHPHSVQATHKQKETQKPLTLTEKQAPPHAHTDRQTNRQTDRQTDRQTHTHTHTQIAR